MNMLLTAISSHLLTIIENELIAAEPEIVATIEAELKLLITKIESFLSSKSSSVAAVVNPILNGANSVADTAINAGANAALALAN